MTIQLHILKVTHRHGVSKTTQRPFHLAEAHCAFIAPNPETGESDTSVGLFLLPRGQEETPTGKYEADLTVITSREGKLEPRIYRLRPLNEKAAPGGAK